MDRLPLFIRPTNYSPNKQAFFAHQSGERAAASWFMTCGGGEEKRTGEADAEALRLPWQQ